LNDDLEVAPVSIFIETGESEATARLVALLSGVAGIRLTREDEPADFVVKSIEPALSTDARETFTPRELQVLSLMATGASNKAIARELGISTHTAKFHVGSLLDKLDATGRTDAVAHASRLGIIHL
jgi:DNA-binding NarL/FixJ family response regulator